MIRGQAIDWERIFAKCTCDKGLVSQIYKELLKLNGRNTHNPFKNGPKTLTDTSAKKISGRQISIWKDALHPKSSGRCKWKQQWDTTTDQLEWPKFKHRHQMLERMWSNRNAQIMLVGMQNGTVTLEVSLVISYKTNYTLTIKSSSYTP